MRLNKIVLASVMFAVGAALITTAALAAGKGMGKQGGTLRINVSSSDIQSIDPGVDYEFIGWGIEYVTCLKLLNYPDASGAAGTRLRPEAAVNLPAVSRDGKTYTFTIRKGLRFNTGEEVTAATFAEAFNRDLNPKLQSPAVTFLQDVQGAKAVVNGKAKSASGIRANGQKLTVRLTRNAPDFLARSAMNFFCAIPPGLPVPLTANSMPSAGPYYISSRTPNRSIIVERNPNYVGPRPHHVDRMIFTVNANLSQSLLQVKAGEADYDAYGIPPTAPPQLVKQFGVNKSRFFVHTSNGINYLAINTRRVKDLAVRKAINYAIDRPAIVRQSGLLAGTVADQILPPNVPGYRDVPIYPLRGPNVARAKRLMGGQKLSMTLYSPNDQIAQSQDQVIAANLKAIGITVKVKSLPFSALLPAIGDPTEPYDLVLIGWLADYPDPSDFINVLFNGKNILSQGNNNIALLDDPKLNARMEAAQQLSGDARYAAYAKLDADLIRTQAPWAPLYVPNVREFVSSHVGCYIYQAAMALMDYAHVCLK